METRNTLSERERLELTEFYRGAVRIRSYSDEEKEMAEYIVGKMKELGFDEAYIDRTGNAVGRIGCGPKVIHFDSHMDTVRADDAGSWAHDPFSADLDEEGWVWGRGSVDMKGGLCASIYAAAKAGREGLLDGLTVYVTGTVCEEYCDGVSLEHFYADTGVKPEFCVICEPSDDLITLGHTGKVQARITTHGVSAHGSAPEKGINAVYLMADIIKGTEQLNKTLSAREGGGTVVLSDISCLSASLNAVPSRCQIYLDRRLRPGETTAQVHEELDALVAGKPADWEIGVLDRVSWTGERLTYHPEHEPWRIDRSHPLTLACDRAYELTYGGAPEKYDFWDFGTNAVAPIARGIPTIGFGPGQYKLAHMVDERCSLDKIHSACAFYTNLIELSAK